MTQFHGKLIIVALAAVTVGADYFLKLASIEGRSIQNKWFVAGCLLYAASAFGWVFTFRHIKLSTVGVIYSLSTILMLTALGVLIFNEALNSYEVAGIFLAVTSIILLSRFG